MQPPDIPSALDSHAGFWLRFVSNHVSARFRKLLDAEGVSVTEWVALRTLLDQPDATHASLIRALGMTKGAVSKVVSRLEEKGWARRHKAVAGGGRDQAVSLTEAGAGLVPRLAGLADQNDAHFFGHLAPAQREALMSMLQEIVRRHDLRHVPVA